MKRVIAAVLVAAPMANAHALCILGFIGNCPPPAPAVSPPPPRSTPSPTPAVSAPEIDGAAGALALALAGGGIALLQRSRRRKVPLLTR